MITHTGYTKDDYIFIGLSVIGGAFVGWILNLLYRRRQDKIQQDNKFVGKMNTNSLKKVIFSPEICENETPKVREISESEGDSESSDPGIGDEEEEEEQMPQFNKRTIKTTSSSEPGSSEGLQEDEEFDCAKKQLSDGDKINATLGKLHGKLATAQLKAQTRQIAAEMTEEEKEHEAQMKCNQMASIMKLMMQNQEKFGMSSDDIKEQMNLYNF